MPRSQDFDDTGAYPLSDPATRSTPPGRIRVLLADAYPIVLDGLEQMFALEEDIEVVGRCVDATGLIAQLDVLTPEVLFVESMLFSDPIEQLGHIAKSDVRIVVFTSDVDEDSIITLMRIGVRGVVLKGMPAHQLASCVRKVAAGDLWLDKTSVARALEKLIRQEAGAQEVKTILSPREVDVLRLSAQGMRNGEVAARLSIAESAVKMHLHSIYEKLNLGSRLELAGYARDRGLIIP